MAINNEKESGSDEGVTKTQVAMKRIMPGIEEVRAHKLTHQAFKDWFRHCVWGSADDIRHTMLDKNGAFPLISLHYTYDEAGGKWFADISDAW